MIGLLVCCAERAWPRDPGGRAARGVARGRINVTAMFMSFMVAPHCCHGAADSAHDLAVRRLPHAGGLRDRRASGLGSIGGTLIAAFLLAFAETGVAYFSRRAAGGRRASRWWLFIVSSSGRAGISAMPSMTSHRGGRMVLAVATSLAVSRCRSSQMRSSTTDVVRREPDDSISGTRRQRGTHLAQHSAFWGLGS
jgi:hypothetical protein